MYIFTYGTYSNFPFKARFEFIFGHVFSQSVPKFDSDYRQVSNIRRTLVGNNIFDHSDVVGASPVGAAPTTSSFST